MLRGVRTIAGLGLWLMASAGSVAHGEGKIYWTDFDAGKIQRANLNGSNVEDVISGVPDAWTVALDVPGGKIYWVQSSAIHRAGFDGSNAETLFNISGIRGLALDLDQGKMYFPFQFDFAGGIMRANLDGSAVEALVTDFKSFPTGVTLDSFHGKVYWVSYEGIIRRANLDGSTLEVLVDTPNGVLYSIALDPVAGHMYWTDGGTDTIRRANLDGSNVEILVGSGLSSPFGIALDLDTRKMYWSDATTAKLQRANLDGSNVDDLVSMGLSSPWGLALDLRPTIPAVSSWGVIGLAGLLAIAGAFVASRRLRPANTQPLDVPLPEHRARRKRRCIRAFGARRILFVVAAIVADAVPAGAQPAQVPSETLSMTIDPGPFYGPACSGGCPAVPYVVDSKTVSQSGATWIRVLSLAVDLAGSPEQGNASFLRLTSQLDGAVQILDALSLITWDNTSAYFNGDAVLVELLAYPDTGPNGFQSETLYFAAGLPQTACQFAPAWSGYCDGEDNRIASTDPRIGRLVHQLVDTHGPHPSCDDYEDVCSAFLFEGRPNWIITAGHCCRDASFVGAAAYCRLPVLEFNVPSSHVDGSIRFAHPSDQYPVDRSSANWFPQGPGSCGEDWCVFGVFNNSDTGLTPLAAQGGSLRLARSLPPPDETSVRVTGFGLYEAPLSSCTAQQTSVGPYTGLDTTTIKFRADMTGGNSGSPIMHDCRDLVYGIVKCGGCSQSAMANRGTPITYPALVDALVPNELDDGSREPVGICAACTCDASGCGGSSDWNENFIKDECEFQEDCQPNGFQDVRDIFEGTSDDLNLDSIPDECQGPVGACAFGTTSCLEMKSACCTEVNGIFVGNGIECADLGACCSPIGACAPNSTSGLCAVTGGTFAGTGTTCTGIGPCCVPDGGCVDIDATCCEDLGGVVKTGYSECSTIPYQQRCRPFEGP